MKSSFHRKMDEYKKDNLANRLDDKVLTVNFTCQRCCQPLRIHKSFNTIDQNGLNTFTQLNIDDEDDEELKNEFESYKNFPYLMESGLNINDFLLVEGGASVNNNDATTTTNSSSRNWNLSNPAPHGLEKTSKQNSTYDCSLKKTSTSSNPTETMNYNFKVTSKLFDVLSDQSTINHPLCEDCADYIIDSMDNQLKVLEDECKVYKEFLENLEKAKSYNATENDVNELKEKIAQFKLEEKELIESLESTIEEKRSMERDIAIQHEELAKVNEEANKSWCEYNYLKKKLFDYEDEQHSLDNQLRYAETHLDKVKNTNIFASAFHIWHDGHFGTINGLRLGRLPTFIVEWSEINAAWGQVVLLLHSLAKKINLVFKRFKLIPYGNHSFIQSLDLPLFGSGGYRFLWDSKYDQAMAAFLDCLQQFQEEIEKDNSDFRLPYKIQNGRIADQNKHLYSIKICRNSEEEWTKALKFMLTDLKWIITYVTLNSIKT